MSSVSTEIGRNGFPELMVFQNTWRSYQARVLEHLDSYLDDKRVHIVAAPGSGKTVYLFDQRAQISRTRRALDSCPQGIENELRLKRIPWRNATGAGFGRAGLTTFGDSARNSNRFPRKSIFA